MAKDNSKSHSKWLQDNGYTPTIVTEGGVTLYERDNSSPSESNKSDDQSGGQSSSDKSSGDSK
ncbi:MAG TPA: hypothetical protein VJJ22_01370 [Candidatus Paceibacterota bacterium]